MNRFYTFYIYRQSNPFDDCYVFLFSMEISHGNYISAEKYIYSLISKLNVRSRLKYKVSSQYTEALYDGDSSLSLTLPF